MRMFWSRGLYKCKTPLSQREVTCSAVHWTPASPGQFPQPWSIGHARAFESEHGSWRSAHFTFDRRHTKRAKAMPPMQRAGFKLVAELVAGKLLGWDHVGLHNGRPSKLPRKRSRKSTRINSRPLSCLARTTCISGIREPTCSMQSKPRRVRQG